MYKGELNVAEEDVSSFLEVANDLLVRGQSEGNVLASDSDNTQNFQNVYQNPVLISPNIKRKFGNAQSLAFLLMDTSSFFL